MLVPVFSTVQLLAVYCGVIVVASVFGGVATSAIRITHTRLQLLVSFVGGLMLGVGILHQWPHAVALMVHTQPEFSLNWCAGWMMAGLLVMFYLLRTFHFHHHEPWDVSDLMKTDAPLVSVHQHDHDHSHDHDHDSCAHGAPGVYGVSWAGVTFGLCLHTILDGVALASNIQADAVDLHVASVLPPAFGTFLGIALHKPLDSLSITSLMLRGGWSARWRHAVNFGYALMCPLGAAFLMIGLQAVGAQTQMVASAALAFSAGVFVSIALSDLLPEVQFHSHDRLKLTGALLLGALLAWAIGFAEPKHAHGGRPQTGSTPRSTDVRSV